MPIDSQLGQMFSSTGQSGAGGAATGFDWSALLGGGGSSSGSGIPAQILGGASSAGGFGGMNTQQLASNISGTVWSAVGNAFAPGSGQFMGQIGQSFGNLVGGFLPGFGGTPSGTTEWDGLHDSRFPQMSASDFREGEIRIYKGYAQGLNIGVEAVHELVKQDASDNGRNGTATVLDAWQNGYTPDLNNARLYLRSHNVKHSTQINEGDLARFAAVAPSARPGGSPLNYGQGVSGLNFGAAAPTPNGRDYGKAALDGAVKGLGDLFGQTKQGQQMQNDGANQWLQSHWYLPTGLAALLAALAYKAFNK